MILLKNIFPDNAIEKGMCLECIHIISGTLEHKNFFKNND
jgi:hypothetical protein